MNKAIEEVESLVEEMMRGVHGYKEVEIIDITPPLALAFFFFFSSLLFDCGSTKGETKGKQPAR